MKLLGPVLARRRFSPLMLVITLFAQSLVFHGDSVANPTAHITVMTRNLYVGASFGIFLGISSQNDISGRVAKVYAKIMASRFSSRAEAIANEIVQNQPDVVCLQEAFLLSVELASEASGGSQSQAVSGVTDDLQILLDALQHRQGQYAVAAIVNNTDLAAPNTDGDTIR